MEGVVILIVLALLGWAGWWSTGVLFPTHHLAAFVLLILLGGLKIGGGKD